MPWLALGTLSIFALSPLFVHYGQQVRPYALITFLSALNLLTFIRILESPRRGGIALWVMSCTLLVYAQYVGILFIAFEICLALFLLRTDQLKVFLYGLVGSALILPWFVLPMEGYIFNGTDPLKGISWIGSQKPMSFIWFYVSIFGEVPGLQACWLLLVLTIIIVASMRHLAVERNLQAVHMVFFFIGIGLPAVVYLVSV